MKRSLFFGLLLLLATSSAIAQTQYGTMSGTVVDSTDAALPGATVTIEGPAMQGTRVTVTDGRGFFRFVPVPPGDNYKLTFDLKGFKTVEVSGLFVRVDTNTPVNVTMEVAEFAASIEVVADSVVVDTTKTLVDTNVDFDLFDTLPQDRFYPSIIAEAPGTRPGNNPEISGGSADANVYLVDGVDTTDPIWLTWGTQLNIDIIDEISVQRAGYTAEYGRAGGGIVNMVTKSGGNKFSVLARVVIADSDWSSDWGTESETGREKAGAARIDEIRPSIAVGGPILRDRLWFFASYERRDMTRDYSYNASNEDRINGDLSTGEFYYKGHFLSAKLTGQINDSNKLIAFYNEDPIDFSPLYAGSRGFPNWHPDAERKQYQKSEAFSLMWHSTFGDNWFLEAKYQNYVFQIDFLPDGVPWDQGIPYVYDQGSGYNYGSPPWAWYTDRPRDGVSAAASYFIDTNNGSHELKFGFDWADMKPNAGGYHNINGWYRVNGDSPIRYDIWTNEAGPRPFRQDYRAIFVQDQWRIGNATLNFGLRAEATELFNAADDSLMSFGFGDQIAPRLGFAYDLKGDSIHASLSRFYILPGNYIAQYFDDRPDVWTRYVWNDSCDTTGGNVWDYPDSCWDFAWDWSPGVSAEMDPNLDPIYLDEFTVGYSANLGKQIGGDVTFIWREQENTIDFYDPNSTYFYLITNVPDAAADYPEVGEELASKPLFEYQALQFQLQKRFGPDGFQFLTNYTYVIKSDAWEIGWSGRNKFLGLFVAPEYMDPQRYGKQEGAHYFKFNGSYAFSWRMVLGLSAYWRSGYRYTPVSWMWPDGSWTWYDTVFTDERGSLDVGRNWEADLYLEQPFSIGPIDVAVYANVFNLFDNQQPTARENNVDYANFGDPYAWQAPRQWQLGFKITY
jgi:hypothetical protein